MKTVYQFKRGCLPSQKQDLLNLLSEISYCEKRYLKLSHRDLTLINEIEGLSLVIHPIYDKLFFRTDSKCLVVFEEILKLLASLSGISFVYVSSGGKTVLEYFIKY